MGRRSEPRRSFRPLKELPIARVARALQTRLEGFYGLEAGPDVQEFVEQGTGQSRETLLVRPDGDSVRLALVLPEVPPVASAPPVLAPEVPPVAVDVPSPASPKVGGGGSPSIAFALRTPPLQ